MTDETLNPKNLGKVIPMNPACFVNEHCIGCGTCVALAPDLFAMDNGHAKVTKQPATSAEVGSFNMAKSSCPVAAIIGEPKVEEMKQAA